MVLLLSADLDSGQILIILGNGTVILVAAFMVVHPLQDLLDCCCHGNRCAYAVRAIKRVVQILDVQVDLEAGLVIGPLSAAVIYAEYGDISNFSTPSQMLAFAGLEPGVNESGTESHGGRMVKRGSSQLRYVLMNCTLPLIRFDMTFATYYAKKRAEGKPHRVALSHVTKKLVRVIFALERQNTDFVAQALR